MQAVSPLKQAALVKWRHRFNAHGNPITIRLTPFGVGVEQH